ncbi:amidohydrolase family protein [Sphingomonas sp. HITSZ_GF]|uniref:metal-dependent hydrolase family protein n=1 Tax=Sphingomonas sp. HITSZ_GF TaxID=3037247 RepID=UPI00240E870C|nr:amidohydrolase family protein [Sphingomonas sp. HITSZ_GF]MDG2535892.1 amidohydrolase family protein [Sphingomonas sp. HITSZ_GF]
MAMNLSRRTALGGLLGAPLLGAARAPDPATSTILIRGAYLFDGTGSARQPRNVRITGNRIDAVSAGDIPVPAGATVIDGAGQTLMPGLTDAHWHMAAVKGVPWMGAEDPVGVALVFKDAERQLLRGFTTVRDTAGSIFGIRDAIDRGIMPGPRCYPSGAPISQTSGHGDFDPSDELPPTLGGAASRYRRSGMTAVANGVPEVLAAARQQFKRGATQIKIMAGGGVTSDFDPIDTLQFTPEELRAIVQAATDWGTYACAHVYTAAGVRRCLEAGVLSIEHGHLIDDATAAMMAAKGAWLSTQPFENGDNILSPAQMEKAHESLGDAGWRSSVGLAKKHGVKVAFGTDLFSRTAESRTENAMLPRLGAIFSNAEVLRIATSGNCELFARCGKRNPYRAAPLGVVKEGAWADLLLVRGNPLDDLRLLEDHARNLLLIVKDGTIYKNQLAA